ncbi:WHG domain-containing protein [Pararobbsia alpina]|uniref:TetR-like C-terminal domain-containing protein n=1 Tax=Pararobbsia alpina TaxID=621374 RepID=UPI0039A49138
MSVAEFPHDTVARQSDVLQAAIDFVRRDGIGPMAVPANARQSDVDALGDTPSIAQRLELLTAVAKEAISGLVTSLQAAILDAQNATALAQWRAMGHAFLRWAHDNPVQFQVMSTPALVDLNASGLAEGYRHIRAELRRLIAAAAADGDIYCISVEDTLVSTRSFIYGLARMHVDGHFPGWGVRDNEALSTMQRLFDSYLYRLRRTL